MGSDLLLLRLLLIPILLPAVILHELAHGLTSLALGDPTAKYAGRLTLNPIRHIDPFGLLLLILVGFGWAKPVPINPYYYRNRRLGVILVALAGPYANFMLAVLSAVVLQWVLPGNTSQLPPLMGFVESAVEIFFTLNVVLMVFNLIPIPPLDGSRVVLSLLPPDIAVEYMKLEAFGFLLVVGLIVFGRGQFFTVIQFVEQLILKLVGA